jgi:hypothetical protein
MPERTVETSFEHHDNMSYTLGAHTVVERIMEEMDADPSFEGCTATIGERLAEPTIGAVETLRVSVWKAPSNCETCLFCEGRGFVENGE